MLKYFICVLVLPLVSSAAALNSDDCQSQVKKLTFDPYNNTSSFQKINLPFEDFKVSSTNEKDNDGTPLVEYSAEWFVAAGTDGDFIPGSSAQLLVRSDRCEVISVAVRLRGP